MTLFSSHLRHTAAPAVRGGRIRCIAKIDLSVAPLLLHDTEQGSTRGTRREKERRGGASFLITHDTAQGSTRSTRHLSGQDPGTRKLHIPGPCDGELLCVAVRRIPTTPAHLLWGAEGMRQGGGEGLFSSRKDWGRKIPNRLARDPGASMKGEWTTRRKHNTPQAWP